MGRLGGDEFGVLVARAASFEQPMDLARDLIDAIGAPYQIDADRRVRVEASVGIALAPLHGDSPRTLLSRADMALYAAKAAGRTTATLFSSEMEAHVTDRVRLEAALRSALDDEQGLAVFYQPIVDVWSRRVTAREALIRWNHPERGWVPPSEFIPVAEDSGLIDKLGAFVLRHACRDAAGWTDGARVAVNVSPGQLGKGKLVVAVQAALAESGLPATRLDVEITESALLNDTRDCMADLHQVRSLGVRVALDDFGTGFSSLVHLRAFRFDTIKIDGSFVRDAVTRPDCAAVVRAVADLGKRLGVTTVAEGVETQAHFDRVVEEGCSEVQGFLFGRPVPNGAAPESVAEAPAASPEPASRRSTGRRPPSGTHTPAGRTPPSVH